MNPNSSCFRFTLLFAALIFAFLLAFPAFVHAQDTAPAPTVTQTVTAAVPSIFTNTTFWATVFGIVSGAVAIWRNNAASTHEKINESLVLGIEEATKIPEVAQFESKIKSTIQEHATSLGVQPILHRIVQDLTEPAANPPAV